MICFTSRSAPARHADLKSQFFNIAFLSVATRKLTAAILLPSKFAPFRLTPSIIAGNPPGSSKLQECRFAASKLAHNIFTQTNCAPSRFAFDKSARSKQHPDKLAPSRLEQCKLAYCHHKTDL